MTFQQLMYVLEVSKMGSMNKAAQNLFITQPNLSNSIKKLENELGISIFERTNRGVKETSDGKEFLTYAKNLLYHKTKIEELYNLKNKPVPNYLRIVSSHTPFVISSFLDFYNSHIPDSQSKFEFSLKETGIFSIIEDIYNNDADVGIIVSSNIREDYFKKLFTLRNIEYTELAALSIHVMVKRAHPLASKSIINIDDLKAYPRLAFAQDELLSISFEKEIEILGIDADQNVIYIYDRATQYNILNNSDAYSVGLEILTEELTDPNLISIPVNISNIKMQIGWIKSKNNKLTDETEKFVECLNAYFSGITEK